MKHKIETKNQHKLRRKKVLTLIMKEKLQTRELENP